jgi:hypothetical protein
MASTRLHLSFWGSVHAELVKLMSLSSTWWLMGITAVLMPAVAALNVWGTVFASAVGENGESLSVARSISSADLWSGIGTTAGTVGLVIGIFGVMAITTEYTTSSVQASLSVNPRRIMFMNAKALATAVCTFVTALIGMLLSWAVMLVMTAGSKLEPLGDAGRFLPLIVIVGGPAILACMAVLSLGLGALCRSTVGGIFSLVGLIMILPSIFTLAPVLSSHLGWMASISACLPSITMSVFLLGPGRGGAMAESMGQGDAFAPNWWQAGLIFFVWTVTFYVLGIIVAKRADIKG